MQLLIIGGGSIGERHLRCAQTTGRAEVALCEINEPLRVDLAKRYGPVRTFSSLESALDQGFDAAVVATPAHLHIPMAKKLIAAGTDVLIEKPLSISTIGIADLQNLATSKGVTAAVAYVYRSHPILAEMRAALKSGKFGRPLQWTAVSGQHFPTYRPAYREIYYTDHATGGGAIQDALTHVVNTGEWFLGPITAVAADADHLSLPGVTVEDTVHVIARHGSTMAGYSLNQHQAPNEMTITLVCEHGTLRFEMHNHRWQVMDKPDTPWQEHPHSPLERDALFVAQLHSFFDAAEGKSGPLCTLEQGADTLRANLAILTAAKEHTWQTLSNPHA